MKYLTIIVTLVVAGALWRCSTPAKPQEGMLTDPHSYSKPGQPHVTHLHWKATVDFTTQTINATASWDIEGKGDTIIFDTKGLTIQSVTLNDGTATTHTLGEADPLLGQPLIVALLPDAKKVNITYSTTAGAEALQWLNPLQTAGKQQPFLFTQSQAILARSWVPCQDSPSIRFTYDADVTVPAQLLALMSAANPQQKNSTGTYHFEMKQPIPSYLLALAVGDIAFKPISERSGVYAEPSVVDTAAWEFVDLEKMVAGAEALYGAYPWERYDVIVLPPSFPFGGMENPRLTFATPTILAGDRSLTSLIAHELAHSWSGNLVTNGTWNDFWLNEGFTVYFEHRIMEKLYGVDYSEMAALLALQDLKATIADLKAQNYYADTKLKLDLAGRNPDDGVTDIAYNKGYFFLRMLEEKYGRDKFDQFVKDYFASHAFKGIDTDRFISYLKDYYKKHFSITIEDATLNAWIFTEDLPADCPTPKADRFVKVDALLKEWTGGKAIDQSVVKEWSTHEWLHFLKNLPDTLTAQQMKALDTFGHFTASGNAEILTEWLVKTVENNYTPADAKLEDFLIHTGRRKFLVPLYTALVKTPEGKQRAVAIYQKARPNYHFVATNTFDKMLK